VSDDSTIVGYYGKLVEPGSALVLRSRSSRTRRSRGSIAAKTVTKRGSE